MAEVESKLDTLTVIKRNGKKVDFDEKKIALAIKKGDVIGQVVFQKYLVVDNDAAEGVRMGGFGSTDK